MGMGECKAIFQPPRKNLRECDELPIAPQRSKTENGFSYPLAKEVRKVTENGFSYPLAQEVRKVTENGFSYPLAQEVCNGTEKGCPYPSHLILFPCSKRVGKPVLPGDTGAPHEQTDRRSR